MKLFDIHLTCRLPNDNSSDWSKLKNNVKFDENGTNLSKRVVQHCWKGRNYLISNACL